MLVQPRALKAKGSEVPAAVVRPRDALVRPRGGMACSRPKLHFCSAPTRVLIAPSHVPRARAVPLYGRTLALVALGRNSAASMRPRASGHASARAPLQHLKKCFQTLFLITLSHNTNLHATHTHFTTPLNCVNIAHYSLTSEFFSPHSYS
ncbi:hypothetical protein PIB30_085591 [Stylosanthes scabra]|uniref:Uncharacterized protein n=1 Tax=Stylosanthes scabra TaxID=79078 RepID=A0ABU6VWI5_9FABA|nr:hypothetical protein [Stylosanthes scabra]